MATADSNADGFIRCCKALHLVVYQSIHCVDKVLQNWHSTKQLTLAPCSRPRPRPPSNPQECSIKGKPKSSSSCAECVAWGKAVEELYYPQSLKRKMPWGNVNPSCLGTSHVEVAKAFVVRLQKDKLYTKLEHLDSASLLMVMMRFDIFHGKDHIKFDIIEKISDARNTLSHMKLEDNLHLEDQEVDDIFIDIDNFVSCIETLHPRWFTPHHAQEVRKQLNKIKTAPVTAKIKDEVLEPFSKSMEEIACKTIKEELQVFSNILKEIPSQVTQSLISQFETVKEGIKQVQEAMTERMEEVPRQVQQLLEPEFNRLDADVRRIEKPAVAASGSDEYKEKILKWRTQLKQRYLKGKKRIRFGKCRDAVADTDDIFVELELLEDKDKSLPGKGRAELHSTGRKLTSYQELLALSDKSGKPAHHILICGNAGSGKTTLMSRIAYEWAKAEDRESIPELVIMDLVLVLDIRKFKSSETLQEAIKAQLLYGASTDDIEKVLSILGKKCLILLDGFDELSKGTTNHALESGLLSECFVVVTTRLHKIDEFCAVQEEEYTRVKLLGFSRENVFKYIEKFFNQEKTNVQLAGTLIEKVKQTPILNTLSSFPILLIMICLLWESVQRKGITLNCMTKLYQEALKYLNKPFETKVLETDGGSINNVLSNLGEPALYRLLENDLQISQEKFSNEDLENAFKMGLVFQEEGRLVDDVSIIFIHKTFQEYCSAVYLSNLVDTQQAMFDSFLKQINKYNMYEMEYLLRFCCGLNIKAAKAILSHVVNLMRQSEQLYWRSCRLPLVLLLETELSLDANLSDMQILHTYLVPLIKTHCKVDVDTEEVSIAIQHWTEPDNIAKEMWVDMIKEVVCNCSVINGNDIIKVLHGMPSLEKVKLQPPHYYLKDDFQLKNVTLQLHTSVTELQLGCMSLCANTLITLLGCMPSVQIVTLAVVERSGGDNNDSISISCRSLHAFQLSGSLSANMMLKLLRCMPSLKTLTLADVQLTGEDDCFSVSCRSLHAFTLSGSMTANMIIRLLGCMPSVTILTFDQIWLTGEADVSISVLCRSLSSFQMRSLPYSAKSKMRANTLIRLLSCMPSGARLTFDCEIADMLVSYDSFHISFEVKCPRSGWSKPQIHAKTLIGLLNSIPSVAAVTFDSIELMGDVDDYISISCKSLHNFKLSNLKVHVNTMIQLLGCMPSVETLTFNGVALTGEVNDSLSMACKSVHSFHVGSSSHSKSVMSANTLIRLLSCMPSGARLTFDCEIANMFVSYDSFHISFEVIKCPRRGWSKPSKPQIHAKTLIGLLNSIPSVAAVTFDSIELMGDVDDYISISCKSLHNFKLSNLKVNVNIMIQLLGCMPSVETLTFNGVALTGEVNDSLSMACKSVHSFHVRSSSHSQSVMSANTMMQLLGCMPSVRNVTLNRVGLTDEVDHRISVSCKSLHSFQVTGQACCQSELMSADTLIQLLGCMPSVTAVILDKVTLRPCDWCANCNIVVSYNSDHTLQVKRSTASSKCHVSDHSVAKLLDYMPSVTKLILDDLRLIGGPDDSFSVSCKSLLRLELLNLTMCANSMVRLLNCVPSVTSVKFERVNEAENIAQKLVTCYSVNKLSQSPMSANTMMKLFGSIPSVTTIAFHGVTLIGEVDGDNMSVLCKSLQSFVVAEDPWTSAYWKMSANTMIRLLSCMPSATMVDLHNGSLEGEIDDHTLISCKSLCQLQLSHLRVGVNSLITLLGCASSVTRVILDWVELQAGTVSENIGISYDSSFHMKIYSNKWNFTSPMSANTLIRLLGCLPLVATFTLAEIQLIGRIDASISVSCDRLLDFKLSDLLLNLNTMVRLLSCMPSVRTVTLHLVQLEDENDSISVSQDPDSFRFKVKLANQQSELIKSAEKIRKCGRFPKLPNTVVLDGVQLTDDVGENVSISCKSLDISSQFKHYTPKPDLPISANTVMRLLSHMPLVTKVKLGGVELQVVDQMSESLIVSISCRSLYSFQMKRS